MALERGTRSRVFRIVPVAALSLLVAAGCGSAAPRHRSTPHGVPSALARTWEARASAIADAAKAGQSCQALQLANSLRDDVVAEQSKLPRSLQSPLLAGVNALADRISCTPPAQTVTVAPTPPGPKPPHGPPKKHGPPGHHGHHGHGDGQGDDG